MAIDEQRLFRELGQIGEKLNSIDEKTQKLPEMTTRLALAESSITDMRPKVDKHETTHQRAVGVAFLASIILTGIKETFLSFLSGGGSGGGGHAG